MNLLNNKDMSIKEIKTRFSLPMHSTWKMVQRLCIIFVGVVPTTTELSEYYGFFPEGTIPQWIKVIVGSVMFIGIVGPKFTVEDNKQLQDSLKK